MSGSGGEVSLIELFREEIRTNVQALNDGLVELERDPTNGQLIEPLMRAAHSIKGAARVVNVDPAVKLAHVAEECLVAAQNGRIELSSDDIDVLLRAADTLGGIGESAGPGMSQWLAEQGGELEQLKKELEGISQKTSHEAPDEKPVDADSGAAAGMEEPSSGEPPSPPPAAAPPAEASLSKSPSQPDQPTREAPQQVVRVTAQSLTRLMGLAGESLVEARWLQPFSKSLLELKRRQTLLDDTLQELQQLLSADGENDDRAPLVTDARGQLAQCRQMLSERISEFENRARNADDLNSRLYHEVIASRMRPFRDGVQGFPRMIRDLARQLGKKVAFQLHGETVDVDRDILEKLEAPLNHILRNSLDHGLETPTQRAEAGKPETCRLRIEARHNAGMLVITVTDDGRGIDLETIRERIIARNLADERMAREFGDSELLDFLFLPGFSTAEDVTEVSGRGVGLDVVHGMVHSVGGSIRVQTDPGRGTSFHLELPITLSVIRAVLVEIAGEPYAFPHNRIDRLIRLPKEKLHSLENRQHFEMDGSNVGIVLARQVFELESGQPEGDNLFVILFGSHAHQYGLVVDEFCGERDLVVRPLNPRLGKVPNINAAAILDDGSPVLIVDPDDLRRSIEKILHGGRLQRADEHAVGTLDETRAQRILVVDDSITVREVQRQLLANQGYEVEVAVDGAEGWNTLRQGVFDLVITDIDMPRLNGIELVCMIKQDPRTQSTPVIIVSYKDREEDRLRGLEAGADYYLTKSSFHDETLLGAVQDLIGAADT